MHRAWCEYRGVEYIDGHVNPLPSDNFEKGYQFGRRDALASQWRSVEDELPEDGKCVLVHIDHSDDTKRMDDFSKESLEDAIGHTIAYYRNSTWIFMDEYFYDCKVDRWMPIPEPPKPESHA